MAGADQADAGPGSISATTVLREYLPLSLDGRVALVVGVWRDAQPILQSLDGLRGSVVLVILTAALIVAVMLFFIFRCRTGAHLAADRRPDRSQPPRLADRDAQSRRCGRPSRAGDRACPRDGGHAGRCAHRHRQLPVWSTTRTPTAPATRFFWPWPVGGGGTSTGDGRGPLRPRRIPDHQAARLPGRSGRDR